MKLVNNVFHFLLNIFRWNSKMVTRNHVKLIWAKFKMPAEIP